MRVTTILLLLACSLFYFSCNTKIKSSSTDETSFANAEAIIKKSIQDWADAFQNKNANEAINLFDSTNDVMLIGSDSSEVFTGREQIASFLKTLFAQPLDLSWQIKKTAIFHQQQTAWAYTDAILFVKEKSKTTRLPYRFVVVLAEKNNQWKWKLYHGSEPKPE